MSDAIASKSYVDAQVANATALVFTTSAVLNTAGGSVNTVPLASLTPAAPAPKSGDTIIDGAGTSALVTAVNATDATAATAAAGLPFVSVDGTLTGDGTSNTPLGLLVPVTPDSLGINTAGLNTAEEYALKLVNNAGVWNVAEEIIVRV